MSHLEIDSFKITQAPIAVEMGITIVKHIAILVGMTYMAPMTPAMPQNPIRALKMMIFLYYNGTDSGVIPAALTYI